MGYRFTLLLFLCFLVNLSYGQSKKKKRDSKNLYINALVEYQSISPTLRTTFSVARLLGSKEIDNVSIQLKLKVLNSQQTLLDSTITQFPAIEVLNGHFIFNCALPASKERLSLKITLNDQLREEQKTLDLYIIPPTGRVDFSWENITHPNEQSPRLTDSLLLHSANHDVLWVYRFQPNFLAAAPPMQRKVASGKKSMEVDSLFSVPTNKAFCLGKEALYFVQADTTSHIGLGFRVAPADYPTFNQVDHIANSLIYITTLNDITAMMATTDQKATLDEFWLNLGGSAVNARRLIKAYYQRVAFANRHFASHKLGWKTDKGMIYIVFGQPDEIIKGGDYETWRYFNQKPGNSRVDFEFVHKPGLFSHNHFQLRRDNSLKSYWYNKVREWRKGTVLTFE